MSLCLCYIAVVCGLASVLLTAREEWPVNTDVQGGFCLHKSGLVLLDDKIEKSRR